MIYRLSDKIWWGNWQAPAEACAEGTPPAVVVNVAHSLRRSYWRSLAVLPRETLYYRFARHDDTEVNGGNYLQLLTSVIRGAMRDGRFPILVHCRVGRHRSPATAIFFEMVRNGGTVEAFEAAKAAALALKPNICQHRPFAASMYEFCRTAAASQSLTLQRHR